MSEKYCVVYNTSANTIVIDDEGHGVAPQEWASVQRSRVAAEIAREELIVVNLGGIDSVSTQSAQDAKAEYDRLTAEWEAEKKAKTDYDEDSTPEAVEQPVSETKTKRR